MATRRDLIKRISTQITSLYGADEARQIALILLSERTGLNISPLLADLDAPASDEGIDSIIAELAAGRPLQYVVGSTEFCGLRIGVREGVLIPRPETEQLVQWITNDYPTASRILDIGTGSGCIALALKSSIQSATLYGVDISEEALIIARENGIRLGLDVCFMTGDALGDLASLFSDQFDVIVSNPPYIPASEHKLMRSNVTNFEPSCALFVPDHDPLLFYRAIAREAGKMLTTHGKLYFEIHETLADQTRDMLHAEGYDSVVVRLDFLDKPRMICCWRG